MVIEVKTYSAKDLKGEEEAGVSNMAEVTVIKGISFVSRSWLHAKENFIRASVTIGWEPQRNSIQSIGGVRRGGINIVEKYEEYW